jgi:hypothetical protein
MKKKKKIEALTNALVSIYDSIKLHDLNQLELGIETLSECFFRKLDAYNIDLNKEMGWTHLKPVTLIEQEIEKRKLSEGKSFDLDEKQYAKYLKWNKKYKTDDCGAIGGGIEFVFIPTGLGKVIKVRKLHKGKTIELDLTDTDNW